MPFYYYKDKYALDLLRLLLHTNDELRISELKKSRFGSLLQKAPVKALLAQHGKAMLSKQDLDKHSNSEGRWFHYTFEEWGEYIPHRKDGWYQTTRPGVNLVLQLNFDDFHNYIYHQLVKPEKEDHPFVYYSHPVKHKGSYTLAWARLDVSLDTGEVLIEEIQTDWLREVRYWVHHLERRIVAGENLGRHWVLEGTTIHALREYYEHMARIYANMWDEAMLSLAIHFGKEVLGLERVFYHTFETGNYLKGLDQYMSKPPRSLYTKLPRRFGFTETDEAPRLVKEEKYLKKKLRKEGLRWFELGV